MVDFGSAIKKPFSDSKNMLIGMILAAIPLVNLLIQGYALKNAKDVIKGGKTLKPIAVGDIVEYIINVVISIIIGIVYMIIPMILIGVGIGAGLMNFLGSAMNASDPNVALEALMSSLAIGGPFLIIGGILALIAALILPMAYMKWLKAGSIVAAFNVIEVIKNCLTVDYIIALIVSIIYAMILALVLGIIAGLLGLIPIIGWIIALLIIGLATFAIQVTTMDMIAQTVK